MTYIALAFIAMILIACGGGFKSFIVDFMSVLRRDTREKSQQQPMHREKQSAALERRSRSLQRCPRISTTWLHMNFKLHGQPQRIAVVGEWRPMPVFGHQAMPVRMNLRARQKLISRSLMSALANLSRAERRHAERYMQRENAKWPNTLKEWPRSEWPPE